MVIIDFGILEKILEKILLQDMDKAFALCNSV